MPKEWTIVDILRPIPSLFNNTSYLHVRKEDLKGFNIYAENYLLMLNVSQLEQLGDLFLFLRCIDTLQIHSADLASSIMTGIFNSTNDL